MAISLSLLACGATDVAVSAALPSRAATQTASTRGRADVASGAAAAARSGGHSSDEEDDDDDEEGEEGEDDDVEKDDEEASPEGACSDIDDSCCGGFGVGRAAGRAAGRALRFAGGWFVAWPARAEAHTVWALNLTCAGLVFLTHPQMSLAKDGEHVALGLRYTLA